MNDPSQRSRLRILLINPYGPLPDEGWREYRFVSIGRALASRGHDVFWWTASFAHHTKRQRVESEREICSGFRVGLVRTPAYRDHIGLRRSWFELAFAWRLFRRIHAATADLIIAADPPQTAGFVATRLARRTGAVLILDVMDLWPEVFTTALPKPLRGLGNILFSPLRWLRRRTLGRAEGVTAVSNTYRELVLRENSSLTASAVVTVFVGIDIQAFRDDRDSTVGTRERSMPPKESEEIWAIYAGMLGVAYDIETLVKAARELERRHLPVTIVVLGQGPQSRIVEKARSPRLKFVGSVPAQELPQWYSLADIGIIPYSSDSPVSVPVKFYDYIAAGLPIINSLGGELAAMIASRNVGIQYEAGSPDSLVSALAELSGNEARRREMSLNAARWAEDFDTRKQYDRFADFVESVVGDRKCRQ